MQSFAPDYRIHPGDKWATEWRSKVDEKGVLRFWALFKNVKHSGLLVRIAEQITYARENDMDPNNPPSFEYGPYWWTYKKHDVKGETVYRNTAKMRKLGLEKHNEENNPEALETPTPDIAIDESEKQAKIDDEAFARAQRHHVTPEVQKILDETKRVEEATKAVDSLAQNQNQDKREDYVSNKDKKLWEHDMFTLLVRDTRRRVDDALLQEALKRGYEIIDRTGTRQGFMFLLKRKREDK